MGPPAVDDGASHGGFTLIAVAESLQSNGQSVRARLCVAAFPRSRAPLWSPMNVLLVNDDGIHAPGIVALHDALLDADGDGPIAERVFTVAPLTVQSATGHGVTFKTPLITHAVRVNSRFSGIAVDGRPADCVKLALSTLWPDTFGPGTRPDLVVSGMNMGANVGINVLYSGTCAAAIEAAFLGIPSIAVSLHLGKGPPRYDVAARHACRGIRQLLGRPSAATLRHILTPHSCLSINVPITEADGPTPPLRVCPMNTHGSIDHFTKRTNPLGETYYWSAGGAMEFHATEPGSDVQELFEGRMTATPLCYDLTDRPALEPWRQRAAAGEPRR